MQVILDLTNTCIWCSGYLQSLRRTRTLRERGFCEWAGSAQVRSFVPWLLLCHVSQLRSRHEYPHIPGLLEACFIPWEPIYDGSGSQKNILYCSGLHSGKKNGHFCDDSLLKKVILAFKNYFEIFHFGVDDYKIEEIKEIEEIKRFKN